MLEKLGPRELKQLCFSINVFLVAASALVGFYTCQFLLIALLTTHVFHPTIQVDEETVSIDKIDVKVTIISSR